MVCAHETGLVSRLELIRAAVAMTAPNAELMRHNPLSKIPTLILDDGTVLFDSPVICEYLDTLHSGPRMFPSAPAARFTALRRQALGDGFLDVLLLWRNERDRPAQLVSRAHLDAYALKTQTVLAALEAESSALRGAAFDIGPLTLGCALSYLDFRFPDYDWRSSYHGLADWHAAILARPSMAATQPIDDGL